MAGWRDRDLGFDERIERAMGLKGNLGSVDLANIFQMLSINQKEGTLIIFDGAVAKVDLLRPRRRVHAVPGNRPKQDSLGRILLRYDRHLLRSAASALSRSRRAATDCSARSSTEMGRRHPAHGHRERAARPDRGGDLQPLHLEERRVRVRRGRTRTTRSGQASIVRMTMLTFNVNSLIMEAARRIDEWEYIRVPDHLDS